MGSGKRRNEGQGDPSRSQRGPSCSAPARPILDGSSPAVSLLKVMCSDIQYGGPMAAKTARMQKSNLFVYFHVVFFCFLPNLCRQDEEQIHDSRSLCSNNGTTRKVSRDAFMKIYKRQDLFLMILLCAEIRNN